MVKLKLRLELVSVFLPSRNVRNLKLTDVAQKSLDGPFSVLRVQGPTCVQSVVRDMLKITCRLQPTGFACRPPRAASASYPQATVVVARVERLSREGPSREAFCVHFALQHCACLQAFPCKLLGCMVKTPLFRTMLRRSLQLFFPLGLHPGQIGRACS